jgi:hypothetical protein
MSPASARATSTMIPTPTWSRHLFTSWLKRSLGAFASKPADESRVKRLQRSAGRPGVSATAWSLRTQTGRLPSRSSRLRENVEREVQPAPRKRPFNQAGREKFTGAGPLPLPGPYVSVRNGAYSCQAGRVAGSSQERGHGPVGSGRVRRRRFRYASGLAP